ncbi:WXG100 family type VII secretion target [Nakamurella sp. PAMC28650]|uniref:WXG100 family type VII secretion target n=1 Tax=Nakamurella sp. PAMC28650 TaxID=2762325 RepID=UPI00164D5469|nr:hypothetical protein [Nakamurella sp. PAMC28650]QNK81415.1 hypothetical protein H7F38_00670 [Nakamurella sp. PAMC28650]
MTTIRANYGVMSAGHDGLVATWGRIESHLDRLDSTVASTADMSAEALAAFRMIKARWDTAAADRQLVLRSLAQAVGDARTHYQQVDRALAAQFPV